MTDDEILKSPAAHNLPELFRALKWGRPAKQQKFLLDLADSIDCGRMDSNLIDIAEDNNHDDADWWK